MSTPVPHPLQYREIAVDDIPSLFFVRTRTRENTYTLEELHGLGITPDTVEHKLAASFKGWLCCADEHVVAFCMADAAAGELWVLAVLPEFEGRGIGAALMTRAERWLWQSGCSRAWLTTDVDVSRRAYGFYRHRGWTDWKVEDGLRWMELVQEISFVQTSVSGATHGHASCGRS